MITETGNLEETWPILFLREKIFRKENLSSKAGSGTYQLSEFGEIPRGKWNKYNYLKMGAYKLMSIDSLSKTRAL